MNQSSFFPEADPSNLGYTYVNDAYSCIREFHMIHIVSAWFTGMFGIACFLTRIGPVQYKWLHSWFGRGYIVAMISTTASSLQMTETGLGFTTLFGLMLTLIVMCIGWLVAAKYKDNMDKAAAALVTEELIENPLKQGDDVSVLLGKAKGKIIAKKTIVQRVFSLKGLHGLLMGMSWYQIIPRVFQAPVDGEHDCDTYPFYKLPDGNFSIVPVRNPNYDNLPWAHNELLWCVQIISVPIIGGLAIGFLSAWIGTKNSKTLEVEDKDSNVGV